MVDFRVFRYLLTVFWALALVGSGTAKPADNPVYGAEGSNHFVDWEAVDWKFILRPGPLEYSKNRPNNIPVSYAVYTKETRFDAPFEAMSLSQFRSLPQATQLKRREAAEEYLDKAMVFHRSILRGWDIWKQSRDRQFAEGAYSYENGLITPTIQGFETAAGLDPANPYTWQHLAFFTGLVGDHHRQLEALERGLETLDQYRDLHIGLSGEILEELVLMQHRLLLDRAWLMRELGRFAESRKDVELVITLVVKDDQKTPETGREALLLQALIMVDQGFVHEARVQAKDLEPWSLPKLGSAAFSMPVSKNNVQHYDSDFCRDWVWAMTHMKLGNAAQVGKKPDAASYQTSFPAHLGHRFWQDMGRIQEHFKNFEKASTCYAQGTLNRPFLLYFPVSSKGGFEYIFGQNDTAETQFLGYNEFFLGGSFFSYAANLVVDMDQAPNRELLVQYGAKALSALTICKKQGIRPASTLALRGQAHHLLGQPELAIQDLNEAQILFSETDSENIHVLRLLGLLRFSQGDFAGSLPVLERYTELKPLSALGWRLQGSALAHLNKFPEAMQCMDTALEIDPESLVGWYNHALINLRLGQVEPARDDLHRAIQLEPENEEINRLLTLIRSDPETSFHISSQMMDLSTDADNSTHAAGTESASAKDLEETFLLLKSDRSAGQPERALELARSLKTTPDPVPDSDFWALVAIICLENGASELGVLALDQALELDPQNEGLMMMRSSQTN